MQTFLFFLQFIFLQIYIFLGQNKIHKKQKFSALDIIE